MDENKKGGSMFTWIVVVLIVAVGGYGIWKYMKKDNSETTPLPTVPTTENGDANPPVDAPKALLYKDGSYTATGNYTSPGGAEQIKVALTLKDDVITDATVTSLATRPESKTMQAKFISGFKTLVVGKKLDEVTLDKVSGSSLTPKGWNDAVAQIKIQAQA